MKFIVPNMYKMLRRRLFLLFRKQYILDSIKKRRGSCNNCSCCEVKVFFKKYKCEYYNKETKLCTVYDTDKMPTLCNYYPFDEKDKWPEFKEKCGFYWKD